MLKAIFLTGEFGVVYRARLGSKGKSGREVAVKTLKGLCNLPTVMKIMSSYFALV